MKLALTTMIALAAIAAGSAVAAPNNATLTIQHKTHGCHSWSFNGTTWRASQYLTIARGGVLTVVDDDVMPHALVQVGGPKALLTGASMKHVGATAHVAFPAKGIYVFKTRAGEDYSFAKGTKTVGEDSFLGLVVRVV